MKYVPSERLTSSASLTPSELKNPPKIAVIIPALDEEGAIGPVVSELVSLKDAANEALLHEVVVVDNGSTDRTAQVAKEAGATVVSEPRRGYGSACLAGMAHLKERSGGPPDLVVFVDGDGSNVAEELAALAAPIIEDEADMVIGSRRRYADAGSLTFPQRFGNELATRMMNGIYGMHYTDLGPFRAIAWPALMKIGMVDQNYGWTVEMQIKAAQKGLRVREIDVHNRSRIAGKSKVAGTVRGVVGAGYKIIFTILKYR